MQAKSWRTGTGGAGLGMWLSAIFAGGNLDMCRSGRGMGKNVRIRLHFLSKKISKVDEVWKYMVVFLTP